MLINDHSQLTDQELEEQFRNHTLKPRLFNHEAHLRLAYLHIREYGTQQAEINLCEQIEGFALALGILDKFNKTVTTAAVKVMNLFMKKSPTRDFQEFMLAHPRLKTHFKEIIGQHYGLDIFRHEKAKAEYMEPDLLPFD